MEQSSTTGIYASHPGAGIYAMSIGGVALIALMVVAKKILGTERPTMVGMETEGVLTMQQKHDRLYHP